MMIFVCVGHEQKRGSGCGEFGKSIVFRKALAFIFSRKQRLYKEERWHFFGLDFFDSFLDQAKNE